MHLFQTKAIFKKITLHYYTFTILKLNFFRMALAQKNGLASLHPWKKFEAALPPVLCQGKKKKFAQIQYQQKSKVAALHFDPDFAHFDFKHVYLQISCLYVYVS